MISFKSMILTLIIMLIPACYIAMPFFLNKEKNIIGIKKLLITMFILLIIASTSTTIKTIIENPEIYTSGLLSISIFFKKFITEIIILILMIKHLKTKKVNNDE